MKYSLGTKENDQGTSLFFTLTIVLIGMFLNQSHIMFGVNLSFSDFFCCLAVLILIFKKCLLLPSVPTMFFFIVSISVIFTAVFYVPNKFSYSPDVHKIIGDYLKLIAAFVYFLLGYNLAKLKLTDKTLQGFSLFALGIAIIGVVFAVFNIKAFSQILFHSSLRYNGITIDPNYFSILQLVSLVYFSRTKKINTLLKSGAVLLIVMSIFASSSKTGLVTLFCYLIFRAVEYLIKTKKKLSAFIVQLFFIILLVVAVPVVLSIIQSLINHLITIFPTFERVQTVFTDFDVALSRGGSGRDLTWKTALEIIKVSPILGIGIGTYSGYAKHFFGIGSIAHNTYLQLTAEWGILLAIFFFSYLFYVIIKAIFSRNTNGELDVILRDILIVFLIGSLAISLNNARPFWLVLGAFMVNTQMISNKQNV